jgi:hypothetical protein
MASSYRHSSTHSTPAIPRRVSASISEQVVEESQTGIHGRVFGVYLQNVKPLLKFRSASVIGISIEYDVADCADRHSMLLLTGVWLGNIFTSRGTQKYVFARSTANQTGIPTALPGRQSDFENSGSIPRLLLWFCQSLVSNEPQAAAVAFAFHRLRSGPFEGPATVKPPAKPEDTYLRPVGSQVSEARHQALASFQPRHGTGDIP